MSPVRWCYGTRLLTDLASLFEDDHPDLPALLGFELFQPDRGAEPCRSTSDDTHIHIVFRALDLFLGRLFCDRGDWVVGDRGEPSTDSCDRG